MISISKIIHKEETRIKVVIPYDFESISKIKTINGRLWSKTLNCWHIPYSKEAFGQLKKIFTNIEIEKKAEITSCTKPEVYNTSISEKNAEAENLIVENKTDNNIFCKTPDNISNAENVENKQIEATNFQSKFIKVFIKYTATYVGFMKSLSGAFWDKDLKCWKVPARIGYRFTIDTRTTGTCRY